MIATFPEFAWLEAFRDRVNADPEMKLIGHWFTTSISLSFGDARYVLYIEVVRHGAEKPSQAFHLHSPINGLLFLQKQTDIRQHDHHDCFVPGIDDHVIFVSVTPTKGPEIEVRIPADLEYEVSFGHPNEVVRKAKYSSRHTMVGTYFCRDGDGAAAGNAS